MPIPSIRLASLLLASIAVLAPFAASRADESPGRAKAQTCFSCHGPEGNSGTPEVPSIAGQPREFIAKQLHLFRDGGRIDAQMAPMTVNLSDRDIDDLAAYFSQVPAAPPERPADPAIAAAAQPLIEARQCVACHGERLSGQLQAPRLAGQQRAYLSWQLRAYRDGQRADPDATMRDATKRLSNRDIGLIADYISRLDAR